MTAPKFAEGDVIVHSQGDEYESTWVRGADGKWRSTGGPEWPDETAQQWLNGGLGRLVFSAYRPTPAVDLPTEPTLGWVEGETLLPQFGAWVKQGDALHAMRPGDWAAHHVTAFTPAVAVPKAALDDLRAEHGADQLGACPDVIAFLTAVDAANGGGAR